MRALADSVASETVDNPEATANSVYVSLIQIQLAKLAAYEISTYDETDKVVAPGPAFGQANTSPTAHASDGEASPRDRLPPLLFGVATVALAGALLRPTPFRLLRWLVLAVQLGDRLATMTRAP